MKSLVLKSPGSLELIESKIPEITPTTVLVKIRAAAICHTDFIVMEG